MIFYDKDGEPKTIRLGNPGASGSRNFEKPKSANRVGAFSAAVGKFITAGASKPEGPGVLTHVLARQFGLMHYGANSIDTRSKTSLPEGANNALAAIHQALYDTLER